MIRFIKNLALSLSIVQSLLFARRCERDMWSQNDLGSALVCLLIAFPTYIMWAETYDRNEYFVVDQFFR